MAGTVLKLRRSVTSGTTPNNGSLKLGELAINIIDKKIWVGTGGESDPPVLLVDYDAMIGGGGGGTGVFTYSLNAPSSPSHGDTWFKSNTGQYFIYINDGDSQQWVELSVGAAGTGGGGGGPSSSFYYSLDPPEPVYHGDTWFKKDTGQYFIYLVDEDSEQWVELSVGAAGTGGGGGGEGSGINYSVGTEPPAVAYPGDLWYYNGSPHGSILMYIDDGDSEQWVEI